MKAKPSSSLARCGSRRGPRATGPDPGNHNLQLARHQAQCRICRHPHREAIEQDFLDWVGPRELVQNYKLPSESALYRHAHALGLFESRRANLLGALDRIIQRVGEVKLTAGAIVSAIRLSAQLAREAAAASRSSQKGIVLAFTGMPESDAVSLRHHAEHKDRSGAAEPTAPENGSPHNNATSAKPPSSQRQGTDGRGEPPHADANSARPLPAAATRPAPPGTQNPGGLAAPVRFLDPSGVHRTPETGVPPVPSTKPVTNEPSKRLPPPPSRPGDKSGITTAEQAKQRLPAASQIPCGSSPPRQKPVGAEPKAPQVAGRVWPRPPGKKMGFARRARWCCTGRGQGQGPAP